MNSNTVFSNETQQALEHVTETKTFFAHLYVAVVCVALIFVINLMVSEYLWAMWPLVGWGFALLVHSLYMFVQYGDFAQVKQEPKPQEQTTETRLFYAHIIASVVSVALIFVINLMVSQYLWAMWVLVGAGFALMAHGATLLVKYGFFASLKD